MWKICIVCVKQVSEQLFNESYAECEASWWWKNDNWMEINSDFLAERRTVSESFVLKK